MEAYSMDLRVRVLADVDAGLGTAEIAVKYRVSGAWVRRLKQRRRETGEIAPRLPGYAAPKKLAGQEDRVRALITEQPDLTLAALRQELGLKVSLSTLWRSLRDLDLTFKKSPPRRRTAASRRRRRTGRVAGEAGDLGSGAARVSR